MHLYIDATDNLKTIIKLDNLKVVKNYTSPQKQDVLSAILTALNQAKKSFSDITQISVNPGPGSFTGSRIGVAIANALGFTLNLPVNEQRVPIIPVYGQPPNITKSKNKK